MSKQKLTPTQVEEKIVKLDVNQSIDFDISQKRVAQNKIFFLNKYMDKYFTSKTKGLDGIIRIRREK